LHNRLGLLVETHSWRDYATRVRVTHNFIVALADMMARGQPERAARVFLSAQSLVGRAA